MEGEINITISGFTCKNMDFQEIHSSYNPPLSFSMGLSGVQIGCFGKWSTFSVVWPHLPEHGGINAALGQTTLDLALTMLQDASGLASGSTLDNFKMNVVITALNFTGDFSKVLKPLTEAVKVILEEEFSIQLKKVMKAAVEVDLPKLLLEVNNKIRPYLKPVPPDTPPPVPPGSMDLSKNGLIHVLDFFLNHKLGPQGVNRLVQIFTKGHNAINHPNITNLNFTIVDKPSIGKVVFGITGIYLGGLDTWSEFDLLSPSEKYNLNSATSMDSLVFNMTFYINITTAGHASGGGTLQEKAVFSMVLEHNHLQASMQLALQEAFLQSMSGNQFVSMGCLSTAVESVNFTQLLVNTTVRELALVPLEGSFERDLDKAIDDFLSLFIFGFNPAIPAFLNGIIGGPLRHELNNVLAEYFAEGKSDTCPAPHTGPSINELTLVAPMMGAFIAFLMISFLAVYFSRPKGSATASISVTKNSFHSGNATPTFYGSSTSDSAKMNSIFKTQLVDVNNNLGSSAMMFSTEKTPLISATDADAYISSDFLPALIVHPKIHRILRYGMLLLLCINIAFFIMSNTNVAASVYMVISMGGHSTTLPDLFEFSLANSVRDMWTAGVYPLSLMIALFSGCWPYVKLLLMIFCWVMPPHLLSEKRRETLLRVLDALGKWSLIDSFVMVLMLVAFRFHIPVPNDPTTSFDVYVGAHIGMMFFALATMLSLVLSHICLYLHRFVTAEHKVLALPLEEKEALRCHRFRLSNRLARFTCLGQAVLPIFIVVALGSLLAGAIIPSFQFVFKGAAALALRLLNQKSSTDYSLINLGMLMPSSSENPDDPLIRFLQATFFIFALAMPVANLLSLVVLWLTPLTLRAQHRLFVMVEVFNAWSGLDVFVLAIIGSLLELQRFAQFIVGDHCDGINAILKHFDKVLDGDDVCFDVVSSLLNGCWVLFSAALITISCSVIVMQTCHSALEERTLAVSRKHNIPSVNADDEELNGPGHNKANSDHGDGCSCCGKTSLLCFYLGLVNSEYEV